MALPSAVRATAVAGGERCSHCPGKSVAVPHQTRVERGQDDWLAPTMAVKVPARRLDHPGSRRGRAAVADECGGEMVTGIVPGPAARRRPDRAMSRTAHVERA